MTFSEQLGFMTVSVLIFPEPQTSLFGIMIMITLRFSYPVPQKLR
jgi:hypothetical protein